MASRARLGTPPESDRPIAVSNSTHFAFFFASAVPASNTTLITKDRQNHDCTNLFLCLSYREIVQSISASKTSAAISSQAIYASTASCTSRFNRLREPPENMQLLSPTFLLFTLAAVALADPNPQAVAAGGGGVATTLAASQVPVSTTAGSLFTVNGVTSATWKLYVQTFATTALGSWDLGPTPGVGSIGLGSIQGTVGVVKTKRGIEAVETPAPQA
ncbi:hypothetical protein LSUE1_G007170 [Lachnellula suecica]|uniref:Uncharacterized protein n=1 Tax=Lachnellula suecica TaxID=602035 RepID=A0A8T9BWB0_9HELO|nr:hypothetical protein LSUE1_G007170 [Lachnellula suecica]